MNNEWVFRLSLMFRKIKSIMDFFIVADRYNRMACRRRALYVSFRDLGWQVRSADDCHVSFVSTADI